MRPSPNLDHADGERQEQPVQRGCERREAGGDRRDLIGDTTRLEFPGPPLESLNGKRQSFPGERRRKFQTHRSI